MIPAFITVAILFHLQPDHTVRLTPEVASVNRGDPLLVRVDVRFGLRRPSHYPTGHRGLSPATVGLVVSVREPNGSGYEVVRTSDYATSQNEISPVAECRPEPYGKADAAFVWVVADSDQQLASDAPGEFFQGSVPAIDRPKPRAEAVFDTTGDYLIRGRLILRDQQGLTYKVYSPPVTIQVQPQGPAALKASAAVRPILYYALPNNRYYLPTPDAKQLQEALPGLRETASASAVQRVLALNTLRKSPPGDLRRRAIAECNRVRHTLPRIGQGEFDLNFADVLFEIGELEQARLRLKVAPSGPRRWALSVR